MPDLNPDTFAGDFRQAQQERREEWERFHGPHLNIQFSAPTLERLYRALVEEKERP